LRLPTLRASAAACECSRPFPIPTASRSPSVQCLASQQPLPRSLLQAPVGSLESAGLSRAAIPMIGAIKQSSTTTGRGPRAGFWRGVELQLILGAAARVASF
jgi:hypothetical protein